MSNIFNKLKLKSIFNTQKLKNILWKIKITFFRTRKSLRKTQQKMKIKYPKIFNPRYNRGFICVSFMMLLCIILSTSYALFVYFTSTYRAADIRMANLTYSIKIDNVSTTTATIPANSTSVIEIELTPINAIRSKYLIYYTSNNTLTDVTVKHSSLTTGYGTGTIGGDNFRIIRAVVTNDSASDVTLDFGVKGGYVYNNLSLLSGEYTITGTYDETTASNGDITIYTYLNGRRVAEMPSYSEMQSNGYIFDSIASTCTNGASISYSSTSPSSTLTVSDVTDTTTCNAIFHDAEDLTVSMILDGQYLSEAPSSNKAKYVSASCDNDATITWDTTDWVANISNVTESPTNCLAEFKLAIPLSDALLENTPPTTYTTVPGRVSATTNEGLIEGPDDDYGDTTYYYRGAVTNNYVSFAGLTWRIIRINGDGSVRIILDNYTDTTGSEWASNGTTTDYATAMSYIAYSNSTIKTNVETWYNTNIGNNATYSSKVATTKYCNDKSEITTWTGAQQNFASRNRIYPNNSITNAAPIMTCPTASDIYNLNVGLMTSDEVVFAGGIYNSVSTQKYYLVKSNITTPSCWWTMAPGYWESTGSLRQEIVDIDMGYMGSWGIELYCGVRPVISLDDNAIVTTSSPTSRGTSSNPYIVE